VKGVHSLGCSGCGGRELENWNYCGSRTWVFGMFCVESGQPRGSDLLVDS
jgi:hypothetical protein